MTTFTSNTVDYVRIPLVTFATEYSAGYCVLQISELLTNQTGSSNIILGSQFF